MQNTRAIRLGSSAIIAAGIVGTIATLAGLMPPDGTAAFPMSVALGIVGLHTHRPQKRRRPRPEPGPLPERGTPANG